MNTTAAATQASVTVATIRTWCRIGAIAAIKAAGRWIIDAASLARRIAIGHRSSRMSQTPKYRIEHGTEVRYGSERDTYSIVRTDGTPSTGLDADSRLWNATYASLEAAELHREFLERTPNGYRLTRNFYSSRSIRNGYYWQVSGSLPEDPSTLTQTWDEGQEVKGSWAEGTTWLDILIHWAVSHAEGAPERIAKKREADAIEEAESLVRKAREAQLRKLVRERGPLATPRQIDYILNLLAERKRTGEGGGFFYGPTDRAGIEELSKSDASSYIKSLTGDY
ncbi:hypothetical protein [Streptomyces xanthophaeus]|uniref:hypothetical protein n=1 Tax=Streptomyces xanthophaeus TaxID=67385 RepID=UPI00365B8408